jgi:hypothetical protein
MLSFVRCRRSCVVCRPPNCRSCWQLRSAVESHEQWPSCCVIANLVGAKRAASFRQQYLIRAFGLNQACDVHTPLLPAVEGRGEQFHSHTNPCFVSDSQSAYRGAMQSFLHCCQGVRRRPKKSLTSSIGSCLTSTFGQRSSPSRRTPRVSIILLRRIGNAALCNGVARLYIGQEVAIPKQARGVLHHSIRANCPLFRCHRLTMARLIAALLLASLALTACAAENRKLLNWGESGKLLDCNPIGATSTTGSGQCTSLS